MILNNPLFLIGLLAVGLPIAVHLFNFRRYRKVYFSNVDRLQELQQETRQQSRLRQWLILAMRILFVVGLVLAFAQPVMTRKDSGVRRGERAVSVYIDNSFSMETTARDGQLLEMARQKAREIAAGYRPGDRFQLLTNSAQGGEFRWLSREEFLAALDEVEPVPATVMLSAITRRQGDFLRSSRADNLDAYVISDFQRTTADIEQMAPDSLVRLTLVPLTGSKADNLYVDTLTLSAPTVNEGSTVTATVTVVNSGEQDAESVPVKLFVGDRERALSSVDVEAGGRATVDLTFLVDQGGVLDCRVEIPDYPITFDDQLFFSLNVRQRIRALEIYETTPNPYLRRLFADDSAMDYRSVAIGQLDYTLLVKQDYVVLNELHAISSGLAQSLHTFVEDGGSLTVVPAMGAANGQGNTMDEASYNQMLTLFGSPRLAEAKATKSKVGVLNQEGTLWRNVFVGGSKEVEMPTVARYYRMTSDAGVKKESLMTMDNGDDYLVAVPSGMGRMYLFAAPLQTEVTDFVQQALFVPTLFNMALYSRPLNVPYAVLGDGTSYMLNTQEVGEVSHLRDNAGKVDVIADIRRIGGRYYLLSHGELAEAGNYRMQTNSGEEGLSFNYSRLESTMEYYSHGEIQRMVKENHLASCDVIRSAESSLEHYVRARNEGVPLWRWCIILALLAMAAEVALIRWPQTHKKEQS